MRGLLVGVEEEGDVMQIVARLYFGNSQREDGRLLRPVVELLHVRTEYADWEARVLALKARNVADADRECDVWNILIHIHTLNRLFLFYSVSNFA